MPPTCPEIAAPDATRRISHGDWTEFHLTLPGTFRPETLAGAIEALPAEAQILGVDVFGATNEIAMAEQGLRAAGVGAPVTQVLSGCAGNGGIQVVAVAGVGPRAIEIGGHVAGYWFEAGGARHCRLGGLLPREVSAPRGEQAWGIFSLIEEALARAGMSFNHVVRTWFFNDRILNWYDAFNTVRTGFFDAHEVRRMPASTGIGAPNPAGAALVAKCAAVLPLGPDVTVRPVRSPLQCDAFDYGSAFSRAIEVDDPGARMLSISGTASIEPGGKSAHCGDPMAQIGLTLDVVEAILAGASMSLADTTRAIAYFRNPRDMPLWEEFLRRRGIPPLPLVTLACCVCRDDLLFELELDAAVPAGREDGFPA
jgi:enamine deaminase RidA (YjgF/YER057c/UK114 family)